MPPTGRFPSSIWTCRHPQFLIRCSHNSRGCKGERGGLQPSEGGQGRHGDGRDGRQRAVDRTRARSPRCECHSGRSQSAARQRYCERDSSRNWQYPSVIHPGGPLIAAGVHKRAQEFLSAHEDVDAFDFADRQAARWSGMDAYPRSEWANAFDSLALPWTHPAFLHYARTKLANSLFTNELARRVASSGVARVSSPVTSARITASMAGSCVAI